MKTKHIGLIALGAVIVVAIVCSAAFSPKQSGPAISASPAAIDAPTAQSAATKKAEDAAFGKPVKDVW